MATIDVQVQDDALVAKLRALERKAGGMQPVYQTIGRVIVNRIRLGFKLGVSPFGRPWAPLKIRRGQPLRDTGRLQRSIVANATGDGVVIGTNLVQAGVQQFGAIIRPRRAKRLVFPGPGGRMIFAKQVTVPARPYLPLLSRNVAKLPPEWSALVSRALRDYFIVRG